jgi:hypothetical protein
LFAVCSQSDQLVGIGTGKPVVFRSQFNVKKGTNVHVEYMWGWQRSHPGQVKGTG